MKVAVAGFEKSGKTTLFNALTGLDIAVSGAQTPESEIHEGVVSVRDPRIDWLSGVFKPKKTTYATTQYRDLAGLSANDSGRNQRILEQVRESELIVLVARDFDDLSVPGAFPENDPVRDIMAIQSELIIADQMLVEKRIERIEHNLRRGTKDGASELDIFKLMLAHLEQEKPLRSFPFTDDQLKALVNYRFASDKPFIAVVNTGEGASGDDAVARLKAGLGDDGRSSVLALCAKAEKEISELPPEERGAFLADMGIEQPAADRLVIASYALLGLISYFTVGEDEVRAWTIRRGMNAREAGGRIHSDIERGFIRAEVASYADFTATPDLVKLKEKGRLRLEGKTYIVEDGDIMNFRFNV